MLRVLLGFELVGQGAGTVQKLGAFCMEQARNDDLPASGGRAVSGGGGVEPVLPGRLACHPEGAAQLVGRNPFGGGFEIHVNTLLTEDACVYILFTDHGTVNLHRHSRGRTMSQNEEQDHPGFTPGPWQWNNTLQGARLETPHSGRLIVMDCTRKGMQSAEPRFSDRNGERRGGIMRPASKLDLFEHPDARLIADAPDLYEALRDLIDVCAAIDDHEGVPEAVARGRAVLARAEGHTGGGE